MLEYRLGRSIAQIVPFYRHLQKKQKEIITSKLLITMVTIVTVKIVSIGNAMDNKIPLAPVDSK